MKIERTENGKWQVTYPDLTMEWMDGNLSEMKVIEIATDNWKAQRD